MLGTITTFEGFEYDQSSTLLVNTPGHSPGTERVFWIANYYLVYSAVSQYSERIIVHINIKKLFPTYNRMSAKRLAHINSIIPKLNYLVLNTTIDIQNSKKVINVTKNRLFEITDRLEVNILEPIDTWYTHIGLQI